MPIPTPTKNESRSQFMRRCVGDGTMRKEYPSVDQRVAVCSSSWDKTKNQKKKK